MRRWWVIGVVALVLAILALGVADLVVALRLPDSRDKLRGELLSLLVPVAALVAGLIAGIAALLTFQETRRQNLESLALTRRGQVADRFTRAIDQLGQRARDKLDVRTGAVYALEQVARDSPAELHGPVIEVLTAFVREGRPLLRDPASSAAPPKLPADIHAALTVVGR